MAEIRIGYFLEDVGQENFLKSLVRRIATEMRLDSDEIHHDVRNATRGRGAVQTELKDFLRDVGREQERLFDLLVVAIDGNCRGYREGRDKIGDIVKQSRYPGSVACAVPDPHIERWYLADHVGLQQVLEVHIVSPLPAYKCERGHYKQVLRDVIRQTGVIAPLGGIEYGSDIAQALDLYAVGKADTGFKHFIDELRAGLAPFVMR